MISRFMLNDIKIHVKFCLQLIKYSPTASFLENAFFSLKNVEYRGLTVSIC